MVWSASKKSKTERGWGLAKLLILIGSLGFFIYGMKLMSEGLQQASGNMLRSMLGTITKNRVKGVLTGFGITSLVQSSSVTTVMTVSFVNAGLMTLRQSAGVMMGANIGTTITAWIILIIGFKVSVGSYAYMLIALAFPLLFIKKGKAKAWATAIVGFCILFIGLGELKDAVPSLDNDSAIVQFFLDFKDVWYGPVMFVLLGALVTVVIQSSSAAMALTLAMVAKGAIPFEVACAMVLGENIGTTITAELASLIANVHAKRSARIHSMFNVVGVTWMLIIFPLFLGLIGQLVGWSSGTEFDSGNNELSATGIALFHTMFNLINVVALIWFVPQLVRLAERTVKSKGDSDEEFKLDFIGGPLGSTAELCILEAKKEVSKFGAVTARMNDFVKTVINSSNSKKKDKMYSKLEKYEEITDRVEVEITDYLGKAARLEMSEEASIRMRGMLSITNDLERVGDIFYQIGKALEKKEQEKVYFTPEQREGLNEMLALVEEAFKVMNTNLESDYGNISMDGALDAEKKINQFRNKLRKKHLKMIEGGDFHMQGALIYANLFSSMEKVGDHIINVSEAVAGEI
ncbi:MAG: Na/Pi cotransporter family protein [Flavobacteriales bacterium]|nr:Na/Pi cotransporter family protein [Flavobacteriales bacterium]